METAVNPVAKFYAPVDSTGYFSLHAIQKAKKNIRILPSDAEYGGVTARRVEAHIFEGDIPDVDDDAWRAWKDHRLGWVIQNVDGSFWWDTLSMSKAETESWLGSAPDKVATKKSQFGFKTVALVFTVAA
ncbi:hypothetical protein HA052_04160 [Chromobacterium haemolyticum]|uniref:Uncharacterized protein n=1 Tax=Chromobacterium fluminis TaxID=3044269 RepID=A0ABX0KXZ5_9NEIS|nr:hypothetical protein [Chromobacterium haemolyticum]NHR04384.1 hypothetical protein [Chromobacterium haemolyticum]